MKRDDDVLRKILIDAEDQKDYLIFVSRAMNQDADTRKFGYHVHLLCDAGLVTQISDSGFRMTNQGHDYLDAIRDEGIWAETKSIVAETGGNATLEIMKSLAVGFLKKKIEQHTDIQL